MANGDTGVSTRFSFARCASVTMTERPPIDELIAALDGTPVNVIDVLPDTDGEEYTFVVALGDMQFGKIDGDGVEGTLQRTIDCLNRAAELLVEYRMRFKIRHVHIAWLGDHVEGFVSQGGANTWRTQLTLNEQIRLTRRVMLHALLLFATGVRRDRRSAGRTQAVGPGGDRAGGRQGDGLAERRAVHRRLRRPGTGGHAVSEATPEPIAPPAEMTDAYQEFWDDERMLYFLAQPRRRADLLPPLRRGRTRRGPEAATARRTARPGRRCDRLPRRPHRPEPGLPRQRGAHARAAGGAGQGAVRPRRVQRRHAEAADPGAWRADRTPGHVGLRTSVEGTVQRGRPLAVAKSPKLAADHATGVPV